MAKPSSKPPREERFSAKEERELLEMFRGAFEERHPNPDRIDCPREKLKVLAWRKSLPDAEAVVTHLTKCSPCFREYSQLVKERKLRWTLLRLAAVAVIVLGVALWLFRAPVPKVVAPENPPIVKIPEPLQPTPPSPPSPAQDGTSGQAQVALLDLQHRSVPRGGVNTDTKELELPRSRLKLLIHLPVGSQEGEYELQIWNRQRRALVSAKAMARIRDYINTLTVDVDTGQISAGKYQLVIRQAGLDWSRYPLVIK